MSQREFKRIFSGRKNESPHQKHGPAIEGQLVLKGKFGFVLSEKPGVPDIYVQGETLRLAANGDRVAVKLVPSSDPSRPEGEIVRVVLRARESVVGVFHKVQKATLLEPQDGAESIRILDLRGMSPQEGDLAVVKITQWPTPDSWAGGVLIEVLGQSAGPDLDLKALLRKYELSDQFPAAVQTQAESFGQEVPDRKSVV